MNTDNLKSIRKKSGKTQKEVAEDIGIGQGTYKNYETGAREPNNSTLVAIANYFNVTTDYLLGREQESKSSLECLVAEHNMTAVEEKILQNYLDTPVETRNAIMKILYKP